jgi:hypothetical protein
MKNTQNDKQSLSFYCNMAIFTHLKKNPLVNFASPFSPLLSGNILPIKKKAGSCSGGAHQRPG